MPEIKVITSKDNPLIKLVCGLQSKASIRKKEGLFVLEGLRICDDACDNSIWFDKLIISKTAKDKYVKELEKFYKNTDEIFEIPDRFILLKIHHSVQNLKKI